MMDMMEEILEILERNARASVEEIALMLDMDVKEVEAAIKKLEEDKVIVGYNTLINWDNSNKETVTALIEVRVTPQRGQGFDKVADRICRYPQVKACYLVRQLRPDSDHRRQEHEGSCSVRS